jgi:hypothetical protein
MHEENVMGKMHMQMAPQEPRRKQGAVIDGASSGEGATS